MNRNPQLPVQTSTSEKGEQKSDVPVNQLPGKPRPRPTRQPGYAAAPFALVDHTLQSPAGTSFLSLLDWMQINADQAE